MQFYVCSIYEPMSMSDIIGAKDKNCTCSREQISRYIGKISGPLLDRIDIHIEAETVDYKSLNTEEKEETSEEIRKRVNKARKIGYERYKEHGIYSNSELTQELIDKYCKLRRARKGSARRSI